MQTLFPDIHNCIVATGGIVVWDTGPSDPYPFRQVDFESFKKENKLLHIKGDCVVRAIALATDTSYQQALDVVQEYGDLGYRGGSYMDRIVHGLHFQDKNYHGKMFKWQAFPAKAGCKRMNPERFCQSFPSGRFICRTAKHVFAVINGFVYDTFAERPDRCIYGAWEVVEVQ